MKPTKEQIKEMIEDGAKELVEKQVGDWISEGKWESQESIYLHEPSQTYWSYYQSRSGSYYTEYYYDDPEITEVVPVEKIIKVTEWEALKC